MTIDEIKAWCKANKVTQAQLAEKVRYSESMLRKALNGLVDLHPRLHDKIVSTIKEYEEPVTVNIPDEVKAEIIKQADALRQNVDEFLHNFLAKTLGIDYLEKKSKGYTLDEGDGYLEAAEEGEGGS